MKIVLATRNRKKIEEIRRVLGGVVALLSLDDFPACPEVVEDGATFQKNAEKKAREVSCHTGLAALADDSGLVVDALGGAPGVYSARYAGANASDAHNLEVLLHALQSHRDRSAHFECVLSFARPDGRVASFSGTVFGHIEDHPHGDNGFGYDPVFTPEGHDQTFAQMDAESKDALSHRGLALSAFAAAFRRSNGTLLS